MKTTVQAPIPRVKGKTIIDHHIRIQLGLTCEEYVVADFIYQNPNASIESIEQAIGQLNQPLYNAVYLVGELIEKKLISLGRTTEKWNKYFQINESDFEELWKLYHEGNKQKAKIAYQKCRKIIDHATLLEAAKKYLKFKAFKDQFLEHTSTWLNPQNLSWEQDYSLPSEEKKHVEPTEEIKSFIHP